MDVLVTGATGYLGGRLVPRLLARGHRVRVLVRDPTRIEGRPWFGEVEVAKGDLLAPETLPPALAGIECAYYLVHSMFSGAAYAALDRSAAHNFAAAAAAGGLRRVVYLGGLQPEAHPSAHLASRADVGRILAATVPTLELRAGPVIGSGSASFEIVRYLAERLPVMVAPRWVTTPVQPIAVRDVLAYLVEAAEIDATGIVEIGAPPVSFGGMIRGYARVRGLPETRILVLPFLAPRLAALWIGLVTPLPNTIAVPLVEGMVAPLLADTRRARQLFPDIAPMRYREAVALALARVERGEIETRWSGAAGSAPAKRLEDHEGLVLDQRVAHVDASPERVFEAFTGLGGERGWPTWDFAWGLRGFVDRLLGGPGRRRGRRHPDELLPGEALDFWRVEDVRPGQRLRLRAEMRLPGRAWLQFDVEPEGGGARLTQTALFAPLGLPGALYWYGLYPVHARIFGGMVRALRRSAQRSR